MLISLCAFSQEEQIWKAKDNISIDGYIKYLPSTSFTSTDNIISNNLIHNRINFEIFFHSDLSAKLAFRNRIVYGELVKLSPNYGDLIAVDDGVLDLSLLWVNKKAIVIHSIMDRAYIDYVKGKWQIRVGRQRINWGVNLAWNTNDLFNAYNIADFDYAERSGTDALRVQYYLSNSSIDFAYKPGKDIDHSVLAALYKFNKWKYDFQFLAANYKEDFALGTGWAGNLKNAGFKGEASFFKSKNNADQVLSISTAVDYFFKKGIYLNVSMLYTSNGETVFNPLAIDFSSSTLSAKKLMPTKYSLLLQLSNEFNPQFKAALIAIYGLGMDILFVMPSFDYSIKENWDLSITGQFFYAKQQNNFGNLNNSIFLRLQYSY